MILLVTSNKDVAGLNIKKQVLDHYPFSQTAERFQENPVYEGKVNDRFIKLVTLSEESIYAQALTDGFSGVDLVVFISRHSSLSGTPTLSVHTPGNVGDAKFGGIPRTVSVSPANAMRDALKCMTRLKNEMQLDYDVCYECTHHGPSLNAPAMFVELGSSPAQWRDLDAARVVAHASMEAISKFGVSSAKATLGLGGPHYNSKFTRMAQNDEIAFGHILPKHALSHVDSTIVKQCIERTLEKTEFAVLDWKGIKGEDKSPIVEVLREINLRVEKI